MNTRISDAVAWMTHHDVPMLYPTFEEAVAYCDDDEPPIPLYTRQQPAKPEAVRLRDELRERALQDQIDALSVSQVCDKDQIARDAITIRNLRGKLASVQPSPAGQGDALSALVAKWRELQEEYDSQQSAESKKGYEVDWTPDAKARAFQSAADELEAALAARQPVAQEPVCFISPGDADMLREQHKALRHVATHWKSPGRDAIPVYLGSTPQAMDTWAVIEGVAKNWDGCSIGAAIRAEAEKVIGQPARSVDLEQFREAVLCWRREQVSRTTYLPEAEPSPSDNVRKADQLLCLIDSGKAVKS